MWFTIPKIRKCCQSSMISFSLWSHTHARIVSKKTKTKQKKLQFDFCRNQQLYNMRSQCQCLARKFQKNRNSTYFTNQKYPNLINIFFVWAFIVNHMLPMLFMNSLMNFVVRENVPLFIFDFRDLFGFFSFSLSFVFKRLEKWCIWQIYFVCEMTTTIPN